MVREGVDGSWARDGVRGSGQITDKLRGRMMGLLMALIGILSKASS